MLTLLSTMLTVGESFSFETFGVSAIRGVVVVGVVVVVVVAVAGDASATDGGDVGDGGGGGVNIAGADGVFTSFTVT